MTLLGGFAESRASDLTTGGRRDGQAARHAWAGSHGPSADIEAIQKVTIGNPRVVLPNAARRSNY